MKLLILTGMFFFIVFCICIYDCKRGMIKMKDNEINVEDVEFKTREFIFEI